MDASFRPERLQRTARNALALALLLACAMGSAAPALAQSAAADRRTLPINVDAASSDIDNLNNSVVFRDVVITQGDASISAAKATSTGLDFQDTTWTFTGNVRIRMEGGQLDSDQAKVQFKSNQLRTATIEGSPARFEQPLEGDRGTARGRARSIVYDFPSGSIRFSRDAWLTDGRNEITGQELVYNLHEQRVLAEQAPGNDDRVRITIRPQEKAKDNP